MAALGQLADWRFLRVLALGVGLALAVLGGLCVAMVEAIVWVTPDSFALPWVGPVSGLHWAFGIGSFLVMLALSVFLMAPVAGVMAGMFTDGVADAVEDRHYPDLAPAPSLGLYEGLVASVNFLGLLLVLNLVALIVFPFAGPFAPLLFWAMNGYLLGREYFQAIAARRLGRAGARDLRRANSGTIWLAGALMAIPLSLPLVNLLVPVIGIATFTHIFHQIMAKRP